MSKPLDLNRRLEAALAPFNPQITAHRVTPWASITFSGTRHEIDFLFTSDNIVNGEELIERLPDQEFTIPGHLVCDADISSIDHQFGKNETLKVTATLLLLDEKA